MGNLVIATNVQGLNAHRSLKITSDRTEKASEKLSSGFKINRAGDDAAGLAISEKMRNQVKGLNMASKNAADGISLIQTAEGALQETHEMLKRMRELVIQGSNDTNISSDREKIGLELEQLSKEIDATADKTEYNTKKLINGDQSSGATTGTGKKSGGASTDQNTSGKGVWLQVGANSEQNVTLYIRSMSSGSLGVSAFEDFDDTRVNLDAIPWKSANGSSVGRTMKFDAASVKGASARAFDALLQRVDNAISIVSGQRAELGAYQNRLEHSIKNLDTSAENLQAAESRIRDTDMAAAMMEFTKSNILSQAGMSMLSQANQSPNNVLSIVK